MARSILVVGAGGVGSLLAARLAHSLKGWEVRLAGRARPSPASAAHLEAAGREGIAVEGAEACRARPRVERGPGGEAASFLLFAVKAGRIAEAAREFLPLAGPETAAAVLSNGLDVLADFPPAFPRRRLVRGLVGVGAERAGPGRVRQSGELTLVLAPAPGEEAGAARALAALLGEAGIRAEVRPDGREAEWRKAMANAVINPAGAALGLRNGDLLERGPALALLKALAAEAQRVSDAEGFALEVWALAREAARATAGNRNSMWQDLLAGRETEIGEITGRLLRRAEGRGIALPAHRAMYHLVRARERRGSRVDTPGPAP